MWPNMSKGFILMTSKIICYYSTVHFREEYLFHFLPISLLRKVNNINHKGRKLKGQYKHMLEIRNMPTNIFFDILYLFELYSNSCSPPNIIPTSVLEFNRKPCLKRKQTSQVTCTLRIRENSLRLWFPTSMTRINCPTQAPWVQVVPYLA